MNAARPAARSSAEPPRGVWSGTALQVVGRVWSASCTLGTFALLAHWLEPAAFGRFTFYLAVFAWLDSLANLGTGEVAVQRTATDPEAIHAVLAAGRRIRVLAGLLGVVLVGGWALLEGESGAVWILLASFYPVTHALELGAVVFRNRISWRVPVMMRSAASTMSFVFVLALRLAEVREPALYVLGVAAGSTIANVLLHFAAKRALPPLLDAPPPAPNFFRDALPLGLSALCSQMYFYIDNVFVRVFVGETELGHYNVAVRFMSLSIMIAQYVTLAALPWLMRCHAEGRLAEALGNLGPKTFAAAGAMAGLCWPWTYEILELFHPGTGAASASFRWLLGASTAIYAGSLFVTAVVATGSNRSKFAITAFALALNLGANFYAVPRFGITGAGCTTFVTESVVAIGALIALHRAGVRVLSSRAWIWLGGPLAFALAAAASSLVHGA
ncbi:MAG: lipopolysaccharide biosynthesis protein [Planctomycetes bacterium]|nr:lipopolysaccharide biosynthesis protein [Planctomycetota bacterium]